MIKKDTIFFKTLNYGRGMHVDIEILSKDMFVNLINKSEDSSYFNALRYGQVGSRMNNIKFMNLSEFEEIFTPADILKLPIEFIDKNFKREIIEKFGTRKEVVNQKRISKKDLELGRFYLTDSGKTICYLGRLKVLTKSDRYGNCEEEGYYGTTLDNGDLEQLLVCQYDSGWYCSNINLRKTLPKLVKALDKKVEIVEPIFTFKKEWEEEGFRRHGNNRLFEIQVEFLDYKED